MTGPSGTSSSKAAREIGAESAQSPAAKPAAILKSKFLLGHSSILTTERYLGSEKEIAVAVNDAIGL